MQSPGGDRRHRLHRESPRTVAATRRSRACGSRRLVTGAFVGRRPPRSARIERSTRLRRWCATRTIDVVHICTPNHLHLPLAEAALAAGKHVICEKPLALDAAGARMLVDAAADSGLHAGGAVRLPVLPDGARGARARPQRADRRAAPASRHLSAGLALAPRGRQLARRRAARRRLARVCRYRLALVRPRRVRLRPSHRPSLGPTAHRSRRASRRAGTSRVRVRAETRARCALSRPRMPPSSSSRRTPARSGPVVVSQISAGRKNRLWIELDGAEEALAFDQEHPEELWCGRREALTILRRDPTTLSPAAARFAFLPARPSTGVCGLLRCVRRRLLRRSTRAARRWMDCRRSRTGCAPR